jgi:hypothetical protein
MPKGISEHDAISLIKPQNAGCKSKVQQSPLARYTIQFENFLDTEQRVAWDNYWAISNHSAPRQNACYGEVERVDNRRIVYVIGKIDEKVAFIGLFAFVPFISRNIFSQVVCLRGPVFDDISFGEWCLRETLRYFSHERIGYVRIGPRWIFPEAEEVESMLFDIGFKIYERQYPLGRRSTGLVSINCNDEKLLNSFSKNTRREVRQADRLGIQITQATSEAQAEEFFLNISAVYARKGLGNMNRRDFFAEFNTVLRHGQYGVLLNAYSDSLYLGGLYLTRDSQTTHAYLLVITDLAAQKYPTLRLSPILYFHGMRWGRSHGCSVLDFEGYSADLSGAGQFALVYLPKQGFRPTEIKTLGQYVAVIRPQIAALAKITANCIDLVSKKPRRAGARVRIYLKKKRTIG